MHPAISYQFNQARLEELRAAGETVPASTTTQLPAILRSCAEG